MDIRPHRTIKRKKTREIKVGKVSVGGNSQISVQSMTNTLTTDVKGTIKQIHELEKAGADIVRVSCPDENSTKALKDIIKEMWKTAYLQLMNLVINVILLKIKMSELLHLVISRQQAKQKVNVMKKKKKKKEIQRVL